MLREHIASTLPPEPEANCADPVCSLKCRVPGGKVISRRFLQTTTLNVLFDFLFTQGFSRDEYKFLTTYPKRDVRKHKMQLIFKYLLLYTNLNFYFI